ncbi:response regulator PleD [Abditibacteriota bacterium]|nr:response regulator PleD [Abditibacteriota bacterium]
MAEFDEFPLSQRPAPRILALDFDGGSQNGGPQSRGNAAVLNRVLALAAESGHRVAVAAETVLIDGIAPEVVLLNAASPNAVALLKRIRNDDTTKGAFVVAVHESKVREDVTQGLRIEGVDEFLAANAPRFEVAARLEAGAELFRARAEIIDLRETLHRQTRVDDLTGVMSRRFFFQQAQRECSRARRYGHPLSCLMLEVNHFKLICSNISDSAGEQVLRSAANIIGQWTRDSDWVSRFADAKFAVLLPETDLEGATGAREKLQNALREHTWTYGETQIPVSVSIGEAQFHPGAPFRPQNDEFISESDESGESALSTREALAGLLEDADAALYIARKSARVPEIFVAYTPAANPENTG